MWQALTNEQSLLLFHGLLHLTPSGASNFFWIFAAASSLFVIVAVLLVIQRISGDPFLELAIDKLIVPTGFMLTKINSIPYSEIIAVREITIYKQVSLQIITRNRRYSVNASLLPTATEYEEFKRSLTEVIHSKIQGGQE
jgi:hypothetical protein